MPRTDQQLKTKPLSPREFQVLTLVARGYSNKQIAQALSIEPETVKTHLERARIKLGAADRMDAVRKAGVPHAWGPLLRGTDDTLEFSSIDHMAGVATPTSIMPDVEKGSRFRLREWSQLSSVGLVGRLLWVSGITVLIGLLGVGLLVVVDDFTMAIHNIQTTGHPR